MRLSGLPRPRGPRQYSAVNSALLTAFIACVEGNPKSRHAVESMCVALAGTHTRLLTLAGRGSRNLSWIWQKQ